MKIATTIAVSRRRLRHQGMSAVIAAIILAAFTTSMKERCTTCVFTPSDVVGADAERIKTFTGLQTAKDLPLAQIEDALNEFDMVTIIGLPRALRLLAEQLGAEIDGTMPDDQEIAAMTIAKADIAKEDLALAS